MDKQKIENRFRKQKINSVYFIKERLIKKMKQRRVTTNNIIVLNEMLKNLALYTSLLFAEINEIVAFIS